MNATKTSFSLLRQYARAAKSAQECCDLCAEPIGPEHRHLLDLTTRQLQCVCRPCSILFDSASAGGGARRLIPSRCLYLADFDMTDTEWDSLQLPVKMAFFCRNSAAERVMALYPSPAGPTESLLTFETWEEMEKRNPILKRMEPDVEALLVNRVRDSREYYLVPIDECYKLVGLIRTTWTGMSGGREVWQEIERFFTTLKERATPHGGANA